MGVLAAVNYIEAKAIDRVEREERKEKKMREGWTVMERKTVLEEEGKGE